MLYGTTLTAPFGLRREIDRLFDEALLGGGKIRINARSNGQARVESGDGSTAA